MTDNYSEQLLSAILDQAQSEPSEFHFIGSWAEYRYYINLYKSTKLIIKILNKATKTVLNDYCTAVTSGVSDFTQLVAYAQLEDVVTFYKTELKTTYNMLYEYEEYLWSGNFFYSFMGGNRF